jgi:L-lactate utilization protein LutB
MQSVTVFEGPIDSLLCKNSIAISGVDKPVDMFDEIPTVRYLFDNDVAGRKKMEYLLKKRKSVFMWNKIVRDYKVQEKVKDFNDLLKYCWNRKSDAIKNYDKYFTNNPLDIRSV